MNERYIWVEMNENCRVNYYIYTKNATVGEYSLWKI